MMINDDDEWWLMMINDDEWCLLFWMLVKQSTCVRSLFAVSKGYISATSDGLPAEAIHFEVEWKHPNCPNEKLSSPKQQWSRWCLGNDNVTSGEGCFQRDPMI